MQIQGGRQAFQIMRFGRFGGDDGGCGDGDRARIGFPIFCSAFIIEELRAGGAGDAHFLSFAVGPILKIKLGLANLRLG